MRILKYIELKLYDNFDVRCLNTQKKLLPEGHIQIGGNFLHMAKTFMLQATQLRGTDNSEALSKLEKAKNYLGDSSRLVSLYIFLY